MDKNLIKESYFIKIKRYFLILINLIAISIGLEFLKIMIIFICEMIYSLVFRRSIDSEFEQNYIFNLQFIAEIFIVIALYCLFKNWREDFFEKIKLKKLHKNEVLNIIGASLGLKIIIGTISTCIFYAFFAHMGTEAIDSIGMEVKSSWITIIGVVLIGPIYEEIIFRGIYLNFLEKKIGLVSAIITQAILFGAAHGNMRQFIDTTLLGIVLGAFVVYTKSIWSSIIIHIVYNAIATVIMCNEGILWVENSIVFVLYISAAILIFKSIHSLKKLKNIKKSLKE
ncbi:MAG: type II CAAX endopeptidase family protein [Romboutsia sp.]